MEFFALLNKAVALIVASSDIKKKNKNNRKCRKSASSYPYFLCVHI